MGSLWINWYRELSFGYNQTFSLALSLSLVCAWNMDDDSVPTNEPMIIPSGESDLRRNLKQFSRALIIMASAMVLPIIWTTFESRLTILFNLLLPEQKKYDYCIIHAFQYPPFRSQQFKSFFLLFSASANKVALLFKSIERLCQNTSNQPADFISSIDRCALSSRHATALGP